MENFLTSLDIKNPGLRSLPPGVERYFVQGGGLSVIEISAEDKIEIMKSAGITISKSPADIGKTLFQKLNG